MTIRNQLIRQAKTGATELLLPENHIGSMAQHIHATNGWCPRDTAETLLRKGEVRLLGVPIRVVPKR